MLSHLGSLWLNWYDGGERWRVSPGTAMWQPYPRMLVMLLGLKTVVDLVLHLWERRRAATADPVADPA